jgi:virulence-associated protein VapD
MKRHDQGKIWKTIWNAGLRDAGGDKLSLIYYVGPQCGQQPHDDAPTPNITFNLPHNIDTDYDRQGEVYDDIIDILIKHGYGNEAASSTSGAIVSNNCHSVRKLHMGLSKTIMFNAAKKGGV